MFAVAFRSVASWSTQGISIQSFQFSSCSLMSIHRACSSIVAALSGSPQTLAAASSRSSSNPRLAAAAAAAARGLHRRSIAADCNQRLTSTATLLPAWGPKVPLIAAAMSSDASAASIASDLRGKSCVGMCGKDIPKLSESEIQDMRKAVPLWKLSEDQTTISKDFVARNFMAALKFLNDSGAVAEAEGHHPDFHLTNYRNISVVLTTHSINALSLPDFILAAKLDAIEVEYSPKWLREHAEFDVSSAAKAAE